jgi:predicted amidohydrolase
MSKLRIVFLYGILPFILMFASTALTYGDNLAIPPGNIRVATTCVKLRLGSKSSNLAEVLALIDKTADACKPDMIVLSESVFTRMNREGVSNSTEDAGNSEELSGPVFEALKRKAVERKCYIAFNLNAPGENENPKRFYNSNFIISPEGKIVGRYDKNRVPEGEIKMGLSLGAGRPVFDITIRGMKVKVGMAICFDLADVAYKEGEERVVKTLANQGAKIVLVSTIGDFTMEALKDAKDNGVYVVISGQDKYREDKLGASAIFDPEGKILSQFTDRTGITDQPFEQMLYRKGQDGSFGYADIKIK